jgi:cytochrome P450
MSDEPLFNPWSPAFHADPYPAYHRLRTQEPIHESPFGFLVISRHEDCLALLRDQRFGREGFEQLFQAVYGEEEERHRIPRSMLFRDPPDHTRLRSLVNKAFTPRVIETMRGHIESLVAGFLDRVQASGRMDVIDDLAYPLPVTVICEMLGVPVADHESMRGWSSDIARSLDAFGLPEHADIALKGRLARQKIVEYFRAIIPERRSAPREDLLSLLIAAEEAGDKLSEGELLATCVLLFIAGHETTVNLIGNGTYALLRHRDQLERLVADPDLDANAVDEMLRYDSPVQVSRRIATTDIEIAGEQIGAGELVLTLLGSSNRDEGKWGPTAADLDVGREGAGGHLSFGSGIHHCLGSALARLEGAEAVPALVRRFPGMELAADAPAWNGRIVLRGLDSLPVTLG